MKGRISRMFLMLAGIFTVVVILFSQSFYKPAEVAIGKTKKEQKSEQKSLSVATGDVAPTPAAVQVDKNSPPLLKIFTAEESIEKPVFSGTKLFVSFFRTLLRATISPNAP